METVEAPSYAEVMPEFAPWPKISRLNRDIMITEKIDGSNACVVVVANESYGLPGLPPGPFSVFAQSRTRMITPGKKNDNFGFAQWVKFHETSLAMLGPGRHYGEWWGLGIQRGYGKTERHFSLFNTKRWADVGQAGILEAVQERLPNLGVVPMLYHGPWTQDGVDAVDKTVEFLRSFGSVAAPGFKPAEGIVVFHGASGTSFKVTLDKDEEFKGGKRDAHENVVAEAA